MDDVDEPTALVPGAHRVIRRLEDSAALAGDLVSDGDRQRVSVDADDLDDALWRFAGAEHIAGVRDVVRTRNGQAALLPWCADALDVVLARRSSAEHPLVAGEVVTLVGSLLRGIIEVAGGEVRGTWWLDDETRPLFVPGEGMSCASASIEIIERIRDDCTDRALGRLLQRIAEVAADHRVVQRSLDAWERELTELAAPRPIDAAVYTPELVRELPVHRARLPQDAQRLQERRSLRERGEGLRLRVSERLGALRENLRRGRTGVRRARTTDGERTPRRRRLLVGAAAAGVVLIGGLMWPTGGDQPKGTDAAAVEPTAAESAARPGTASASPAAKAKADEKTPGGPGPGSDAASGAGSIEDITAALLHRIDVCRTEEDSACTAAIVPGAGDDVQGRLAADEGRRDLSLIEDYGDIAVVRIDLADEQGEQMVVIARQNDEWLVRDVYDVADQPSDKG